MFSKSDMLLLRKQEISQGNIILGLFLVIRRIKVLMMIIVDTIIAISLTGLSILSNDPYFPEAPSRSFSRRVMLPNIRMIPIIYSSGNGMGSFVKTE